METELRRALAKREMIRAAKTISPLQAPPIATVALVECLQMYLNTPSEFHDAAQRAVAIRSIDGFNALIYPTGLGSLGEWLRRGQVHLPTFNFEGSSTLAWYMMFSSAAYGARLLGDTATALMVVYLVNQYASQIEAQFPTMSEMLRETHDAKHDKPIQEHLLRDAAGGRAANG